ncbi:complement factor I isoform X2 [Stegostoma tigrinum]|uniref:complement factor I isoform X2 n=1 Tax=Stegostoma tigrinum TaxID=3053191 RepID=UPI00286FC629|nr:complement factor I isoform X2 [Stegostoma tigrinum]
MILSVALLFLVSLSVTAGQQQYIQPRESDETEINSHAYIQPCESDETESNDHFGLTPRESNQTVNNNHTFLQPKESNETVNSSHTISNPSNVHLQRLAAGCRDKNFTYTSCQKIFCQPWEKCIHGNCVCKLPYQCPKNGGNVCSGNAKKYRTYCQLKSIECFRNSETFSHFGACSLGHAVVSWRSDRNSQGIVLFSFNQTLQELSICMNQKSWTMHEANVFCRQLNFPLGAEKILTPTEFTNWSTVTNFMNWSNRMRCRGFETSLSECFRLTDIEKPQKKCRKEKIAAVKCYDYPPDKKCTNVEFTCVNGKCIPLEDLCNGIDDCADLSDESCCKSCSNSHHCKSDVCIPYFSRCDGEDDCLDGSDEKNCTETSKPKNHNEERRLLKSSLAKISCGISNVTRDTHTLKRSKRLVGGKEALQGQFPWQIAVYDGTKLNCGGVFIGGCWILTAAHCLRLYHMSDYVVRIAKYNKRDVADNEEILPVEKIVIHHDYQPKTYQNDIALIKVVHIFSEKECIPLSHDVLPVCVPWSEYLFRPEKSCVISGWGSALGDRVSILRWAELDIFGNCSEIYESDFYAGMECAGKMDGTVDACKGDSGGPLVCTDERNEAYVWGLVSWGEECGKYGHPGVYTKVSHYFEWISSHVGRALISKYNI